MRAQGLLLPSSYQRERRELAKARTAAFAAAPSGPDQVWQLDFSEFETNHGGTWRIAACRDYWSKYEYDAHVSPTANMHDAVAAVELALAEYQALRGRPLLDACERDQDGNLVPAVTVVTDNGGPFRSFTFEAFIAAHQAWRTEYNTVRPHEAIASNRPAEVHLGHPDPTVPTFQAKEILPRS